MEKAVQSGYNKSIISNYIDFKYENLIKIPTLKLKNCFLTHKLDQNKIIFGKFKESLINQNFLGFRMLREGLKSSIEDQHVQDVTFRSKLLTNLLCHSDEKAGDPEHIKERRTRHKVNRDKLIIDKKTVDYQNICIKCGIIKS